MAITCPLTLPLTLGVPPPTRAATEMECSTMATMARPINGQAGESYLWPRKSPYYFDKDKLLPTPSKVSCQPNHSPHQPPQFCVVNNHKTLSVPEIVSHCEPPRLLPVCVCQISSFPQVPSAIDSNPANCSFEKDGISTQISCYRCICVCVRAQCIMGFWFIN